MPSVDRTPDLVRDLREQRSRLAELERPKRVMCVLKGGAASLPDGTMALLSFSTVQIDTASMFDPASPTQIVVPRAGVYSISGSASITPNGDSTFRSLDVIAMSQPEGETRVGFFCPALPSDAWRAAPSTVVPLDAGDTVTLGAAQASGTTLSAFSGRLAVVWVGPADA